MSRRATLLGFDFGKKRIGVAVGQPLTGTATPLAIIPVHNNRPAWKRITALVRQWAPGALVVGDPLRLDGGRQAVTAGADRFARQLQGRYGLPVFRADERLSTFEARARRRGAAPVDDVAAQVILEGWMQRRAAGALPGEPAAGEEQ